MEMRLVTTPADSLAPGVFVVPRYMALTGWIDRVRRDTTRARCCSTRSACAG
jgi:hypothetical protein